ncbi:MAG: undecaprenyldiphospho-muramoylpentapeptide beta-N-acetylglucosaminyltransferase [Alphaproteobacteria bacterium]|nr:undecaprenyldiphospho-muramoylpentapeptide beta-N-acetylglucosaminyltransferase [Alphaproteobacteria bacterium]
MKKKLVIVTTGGSGGHMFPAEAIAGALLRRGFEVVFMTDKRGQAFRGLADVPTYRLMAESIVGRSVFGKALGAAKLFLGAVQALGLVRKLKPACVVGVGGYASIPAVMAAHLWHIPIVLHEQNAVLGRANRMLARGVQVIATSFAPTMQVPGGVPAVQVGMPARGGILAKENAPYPSARSGFNLLVFGGSQGARFFSAALPKALLLLPAALRARIRLTQQARPEDIAHVREIYRKAGFQSVTIQSFFDNMPDLLAQSHLVIARAGASTLTELMIVGRPAILIPLPTAADNHQTENARLFCDAGAGWLVAERDFIAAAFAGRLEDLMRAAADLKNAGAQAARLARPQAAAQVAELVHNIVQGKKIA